MPQTHLAFRRDAVTAAVLMHVERRDPLLVLKAPPGSGKRAPPSRPWRWRRTGGSGWPWPRRPMPRPDDLSGAWRPTSPASR